MTTFIIHCPVQTKSNGTKIGHVITCNSLDKLKMELLNNVTNDNINNIKVIGINGECYMFHMDESGGYFSSGNNIIEVPEVMKKLFPTQTKYIMLFNDSCQSYNYNGLKDMISQLQDIPFTWKIITQPDCIVYTYDPQSNLFKASNGSALPNELTKHLSTNYKLIMHFYEDLNNPTNTIQKVMCLEQFASKNKSVEHVKTYLMHLAQKLKYIPSDHKNLYRIDIICNDEKVGEINEVGLYYNHNLVTNSLYEPFESFKVIMKSVKEIIANNIKENPKPTLMHKLNELKTMIDNCSDKEKLNCYLNNLNMIF